MKRTNGTRWLIWACVIAVVGIEAIFLLLPSGKEQDAVAAKKPAVPASKLSTVPIAPPKKIISPEAVAAASIALAPAVLQPAVSGDPLSLEALQRAVQPTGARPNEALFTFKNPAAYQAFLKRNLGSGVAVKEKLDDLLTARVGFETLEQLRAELVERGVNDAEMSANYMVAIPRLPAPENRPAGGDAPFNETVFASMGISATAERSDWGAGVNVAVIDSGVGEHPTFRADQVTHIDLVQDGLPFEGHGTAIASLIAGNMNGAQGVAPGAQIIDVRVAGGNGDSDSFILARGITTALERGADVINVSMGSYGDAPVVQAAVQRALDKGVHVVASAGNEQAPVMAWPAAYDGVISVSGVDAKGALASFSNTGNPTLAAPAVGIPSAYYHESRPYLGVGSGTSQSAALVSGAVAAIISHRGNVVLTLRRNAAPLQVPARSVGAGMVRLPGW
ncbi:hypothetical protein AYO49_04835 [Verrucomicrobiaceae bacterium SCGC AG-212-N21]|nr:hypothetical protein AYO49_04835 [Verrucomicrobiaceae bacterium SCGC AG-212-N21]